MTDQIRYNTDAQAIGQQLVDGHQHYGQHIIDHVALHDGRLNELLPALANFAPEIAAYLQEEWQQSRAAWLEYAESHLHISRYLSRSFDQMGQTGQAVDTFMDQARDGES